MREHEVINRCRSGTIVSEQFLSLEEDLLSVYPDVVIINFGIIEVFERQTLRRINNLPIRNYYNNSVLGRKYRAKSAGIDFWARVFNFFSRIIAKALGLRWRWLDTSAFIGALRVVCDIALKETSAVVILIELPVFPGASSRYSAATNDEIRKINMAMYQWQSGSLGRIKVLSLEKWIADPIAHARFYPDGIHFSALGHRVIAGALRRELASVRR